MDHSQTFNETGLTNARQEEAAMLRLCADLAKSRTGSIPSCRHAQVVRLASQLLRSSHPAVAALLQQAYETHECEQCDSFPVTTALDKGWVLGLARFKDMLGRQLDEKMI